MKKSGFICSTPRSATGRRHFGVDFSVEDKLLIARRLDALGIDYIEGGYPGANPVDTAFFEAPPRLKAKLASFGMTKRAGRSTSNDPGFQAVVQAKADAVVLVAKSWDFHVELQLGISEEENLEAIRSSVEAIRERDRRRSSTASTSSTATRRTRSTRLPARGRLRSRRALGGALRHEWRHAAARGRRDRRSRRPPHPAEALGIHAHNDTENGVANTLAAIRAGARQVHGTLNGLGERCGNANLTSIIPTLLLKDDYASALRDRRQPEALRTLTAVSRAVRRDPEPPARPARALCGRIGLRA